jgi:GNAT superfamily N-acetyltransferase
MGDPEEAAGAARSSEAVIRPAMPGDVPAMVQLVSDLAAYERAADQVELSPESLEAALFGDQPAVFAHVAEVEGEVAGFALWFLSFSSWLGRHGIYLEDLYVRPERRGAGLGTALLAELARLCVERGYGRLEWSVLDWNTPAIDFYLAHGAGPQRDWMVFRLTGEPLRQLVQRSGHVSGRQAVGRRPRSR